MFKVSQSSESHRLGKTRRRKKGGGTRRETQRRVRHCFLIFPQLSSFVLSLVRWIYTYLPYILHSSGSLKQRSQANASVLDSKTDDKSSSVGPKRESMTSASFMSI